MLIGLYGAGNLGKQISECLEVDHVFVDDTPKKQGNTYCGRAVWGLEKFVTQAKKQDHRLYLCIFLPQYDLKANLSLLKEKYDIDCRPFTSFLFNTAKRILPFLFFEKTEIFQKKIARYQLIKSKLSDQLSKDVLDSHLTLRETGDFSQLIVTDRADLPFLNTALKNKLFHYLDCGGYDGSTAIDFHRKFTNQLKSVTVVEPDPENLLKIQSALGSYNFYETPYRILNAAVSGEVGEAHFQAGMGTASALSTEGRLAIKTVSLSSLNIPFPSYIKLDIEGTECGAILASKRYLLKERPFLGISVYHAPDDLLVIAEFLMKETDYQLFIRCHGPNGEDLMLYAI